jgi:hypothetical protein
MPGKTLARRLSHYRSRASGASHAPLTTACAGSNSATWRSRRWQSEHPHLTWQAVSERMPDTLLRGNESYAILQKTPYHGLFDPDQVGITPVMLHTGAPHGFVCQYSVARETLILCSLEIRAKDGVYPLINDTLPRSLRML